MSITDKITTLLKEAISSSDKKKIDKFISFLKKTKVKKVSSKEFEKLAKGSKIKVDDLVSLWLKGLKSGIEDAGIKVENIEFSKEEKDV